MEIPRHEIACSFSDLSFLFRLVRWCPDWGCISEPSSHEERRLSYVRFDRALGDEWDL